MLAVIDSRGYGFVQDDTFGPSFYDNRYILYCCPAVLMTEINYDVESNFGSLSFYG